MSAYQFLRPSIIAVAIGLSVVGFCTVLQSSGPDQPAFSRGLLGELRLPSASLTPKDVVTIQIESLQHEVKGFGALQCYCFAAPSNRIITGPVSRFAKMVRQPPFDELGECQSYSIGRVTEEGSTARCMVVVLGEDQQLHVFGWVLKKQTEEPFQSCWMTAGVFSLDDSESDDSSYEEEVRSLPTPKGQHITGLAQR